MPLPQRYHHVSGVQAVLTVNDWQQRAYAEWQAYAEWWQAHAQRQAYAEWWQAHAQWLAYTQWQRSPCNDNRATQVETPTPTRKRRASLETFIAQAQRAAQRIGFAVRAIEEKADGARIAHFGTPTDNAADNEWNVVLRKGALQ